MESLDLAGMEFLMKAGVDCLSNPRNYEARANMLWASSLAHNGLTQCGREFQLVVHQFEHPKRTIEEAINRQEQFYSFIGMPTNLKALGVQKNTLEKLALDCSRNKTRTLMGYKKLEYDDILEIYKMAYDNNY